jgi:hypothetical protein
VYGIGYAYGLIFNHCLISAPFIIALFIELFVVPPLLILHHYDKIPEKISLKDEFQRFQSVITILVSVPETECFHEEGICKKQTCSLHGGYEAKKEKKRQGAGDKIYTFKANPHGPTSSS